MKNPYPLDGLLFLCDNITLYECEWLLMKILEYD